MSEIGVAQLLTVGVVCAIAAPFAWILFMAYQSRKGRDKPKGKPREEASFEADLPPWYWLDM